MEEHESRAGRMVAPHASAPHKARLIRINESAPQALNHMPSMQDTRGLLTITGTTPNVIPRLAIASIIPIASGDRDASGTRGRRPRLRGVASSRNEFTGSHMHTSSPHASTLSARTDEVPDIADRSR